MANKIIIFFVTAVHTRHLCNLELFFQTLCMPPIFDITFLIFSQYYFENVYPFEYFVCQKRPILLYRDLYFFLCNLCNLYLVILCKFSFQIHKYHCKSDSLLQGYQTIWYISNLQVVEALHIILVFS